jgi:hypothetical protein
LEQVGEKGAMTTHTQTGQWGYRLGRGAGHAGRWLARVDRKANGFLLAQGMNANLARGILRVTELVLFAILLYGAFWVALLLVSAVVAVWVAGQTSTEDDTDFLGREAEERDHRESVFYHPASYDDDPDPRFEND